MTRLPSQPLGRPADQQKDQAILTAARELLLQQGPAAVTIEAVARRAGVSKVTVYARHSNREALISAVIRSQAEVFSAFLPLPLASLEEVRDALYRFSLSVLEFFVSPDNLQFLRLIGASANLLGPLLKDIYTQGAEATLQRLQHWLAALDQAGLIDCPAAQRSAEVMVGMLLRQDLMRTLFGVSITHDAEELQAHARFAVDGFLKMHARAAA